MKWSKDDERLVPLLTSRRDETDVIPHDRKREFKLASLLAALPRLSERSANVHLLGKQIHILNLCFYSSWNKNDLSFHLADAAIPFPVDVQARSHYIWSVKHFIPVNH